MAKCIVKRWKYYFYPSLSIMINFKKSSLTLIIGLILINMNAQESEIFTIVETMPVFPGCETKGSNKDKDQCTQNALFKHIMNNARIPMELKDPKRNMEATIYVSFVIDSIGELSDVRILKSSIDNKYLQLDAIRTVKTLPKMIPGTQRGKAVKVQYNIPIRYRLSGMKRAEVPLPIDSVEFFEVDTMNKGVGFTSHNGDYNEFIAEVAMYPDSAMNNCISGKVYLNVSLDSLGQITSIENKYESFPILTQAAIKAVRKTNGHWQAAKKDGKSIKSIVRIIVPFRLEDGCKTVDDYYNSGVTLFEKGELAEAAKNFKRAILMDGQDFDAVYNFAICSIKLERIEEACKYLNYIRYNLDAKNLIDSYCKE